MTVLLNMCLLSMMPEAETGICSRRALAPLCSQTNRGVLCLEGVSPFKKTQKAQYDVVKRVREVGQRVMLGLGTASRKELGCSHGCNGAISLSSPPSHEQ